MNGKKIALYGINGIGKTTQAELLVAYLRAQGKDAHRLKYPIYDLEPEGPFLNQYLRDPEFRSANPKTTHELQTIYAENRRRYQSELTKRLERGEWIVAEDYVGTGIAWGLAWGGDLNFLEKVNQGLRGENISILMHGDRFLTALETTHRNESEAERIEICKNFLYLLAGRYNWHMVNANQSQEEVHRSIIELIPLQ